VFGQAAQEGARLLNSSKSRKQKVEIEPGGPKATSMRQSHPQAAPWQGSNRRLELELCASCAKPERSTWKRCSG
jgi:hypothetical protein